MNWLERARREIPHTPQSGTDKTDKTGVSSVLAVPHPEESGNFTDLLNADPSTATRPFNQDDMDDIKAGKVVHVWSDFLGEWLLWVRGETERKALKAKGCRPPVYTLGELALVASWPAEDILKAHRFKKEFGGLIQSRDIAPENRPISGVSGAEGSKP